MSHHLQPIKSVNKQNRCGVIRGAIKMGVVATYFVASTVLRTVLTDLKNKHDLDIYDLRNAQNFAKIL